MNPDLFTLMTNAQIAFGIATIALILMLIFLSLHRKQDKKH